MTDGFPERERGQFERPKREFSGDLSYTSRTSEANQRGRTRKWYCGTIQWR